jgi:hypothetical protein
VGGGSFLLGVGWEGGRFFRGDNTGRRFFHWGPLIVKVSYGRLLSICFVSIVKQTTVTTHTHTKKRQHQEGPNATPAPPGSSIL